MNLPEPVLQLIKMALAEDIGAGDVTARMFVPETARARGVIVARESGVLAGGDVAKAVFETVDSGISCVVKAPDGARLERGTVVLDLSGPARGLLTGERTALNFLQRLSGIATATARYVEAVRDFPVRILDTRKTMPGWRWLEKAAVKAGGGTNHRHGLYDMVMVKDNHLQQAGSLTELQAGIDRTKAAHPDMGIEVEADTVEQTRRFLTLKNVGFILLDNMTLEDMKTCVELARGTGVKLEASGNITLERLPLIAATGVDFISSGALTHSVKALDLALDFTVEEEADRV